MDYNKVAKLFYTIDELPSQVKALMNFADASFPGFGENIVLYIAREFAVDLAGSFMEKSADNYRPKIMDRRFIWENAVRNGQKYLAYKTGNDALLGFSIFEVMGKADSVIDYFEEMTSRDSAVSTSILLAESEFLEVYFRNNPVILQPAVETNATAHKKADRKEWRMRYGGSGYDEFFSVIETGDGGFLGGGLSLSTDIPGTSSEGNMDVEGWFPIKPSSAYLLKIDAGGKILRQSLYGGEFTEEFHSLYETADGGFLCAGCTGSSDIPGTKYHGGTSDAYLVKTTADGIVQWEELYGGKFNDYFHSVIETPEGKIFCAGNSMSIDIDVSKYHGGMSDAFLVAVDDENRTYRTYFYGGKLEDGFNSIIVTHDSGLLGVGFSRSVDIQATNNAGGSDGYFVKINGDGSPVWQLLSGGSNDDKFNSASEISDGFLLCGGTSSSPETGEKMHGRMDAYIAVIQAESRAGHQ